MLATTYTTHKKYLVLITTQNETTVRHTSAFKRPQSGARVKFVCHNTQVINVTLLEESEGINQSPFEDPLWVSLIKQSTALLWRHSGYNRTL